MIKNLKIIAASIVLLLVVALIIISYLKIGTGKNINLKNIINPTSAPGKYANNPLSIEFLREQKYPGSEIKIEQTLSPGANYNQYIASYMSDGLKIYGLLTIPNIEKPIEGFPAIIFVHGYIPPEQYVTTERYVAYVDGFAREGYVVFKPDLRGNGNSEGDPTGAYYSSGYVDDVLNALASIKKYQEVNPQKIGMWGHSMGGYLTLRAMVISPDIKVGVIWGGVVGTYDQLMNDWHRSTPFTPSPRETAVRGKLTRQNFIAKYGTPEKNPEFWNSIDSRAYLNDISGPLQLDQGLADEEVPPLFSESLKSDLVKLGKTVELYEYKGADHNISGSSFPIAMQRSVDFFNQYLK